MLIKIDLVNKIYSYSNWLALSKYEALSHKNYILKIQYNLLNMIYLKKLLYLNTIFKYRLKC